MTLNEGDRLGPYEILGAIGSGGMGEVYRARDTRLDRSVAIKVLPAHLTESPELRQRFEREARAVSSLNHPHICTLYDVGRENGIDYLVMEHIDGETLAKRLERGPLPADQVLRHGIEIADALDRAHRSGIVHRDLKPGNVMLTRSGAKLLDFGLARATAASGPAGALSQTPTLTHPLTAEGSIVGTFQYMAPEQLEGHEADARSDLFSLGAVLYEMATGKKAFEGKSQASLIAAILERDPAPISAVAPLAPPALDRLVRACLAKDPEQRIQTAHDVKLQLQWIAEGGSLAGVPAPVQARRRHREKLAWALAGAATLTAIVFAAGFVSRRPVEQPVTRFQVPAPPGSRNMTWPRISPDGRMVAFQASDSTGKTMIWVRPLNAIDAYPLRGTEGAARPFWSPDSRFVAFFAERKLKKVPVTGGPAQLICEATGADGAWGASNVILFDGSTGDSIQAVPASGGTPAPASFIDRSQKETGHAWPQFLPDGKHFLFISYQSGGTINGTLKMGTLGKREARVVGAMESRAEYAPPGKLVYVEEGILVARPFDARSGKFSGEPVPLADRVALLRGRENFSVSQSGALAYQADAGVEQSSLVWLDRQGKRLGVEGQPGGYVDFTLSPDGRRVAMQITGQGPSEGDIWVRDLERGTTSRLSFEPGLEVWPTWSPDGQWIAYASDATGAFSIVRRHASGAGVTDTLHATPGINEGPTDWSRDGNHLAFQSIGTESWNLAVVPLADRKHAVDFANSKFTEQHARFSPDGRWLAYTSDESGRSEVYVQAFPGPSGKWQVSTHGGRMPQWRADGKELFYLAPSGQLMAVPVSTVEGFQAGTPAGLFAVDLVLGTFPQNRFAATRDGQRFLVNVPLSEQTSSPFTVVTGWPAELAKK